MAFLVHSVFCLYILAVVVNGGRSSFPGREDSDDALSKVMSLEVVMTSSGSVIHEALDSAHIQLRVTFTDGQKHGGISLYECQAVSGDGQREVKLTDHTGCPAQHSPMGCMVEHNDVLVSPEFELSSLAEAGDVNITCLWETCSSPRHPKCRDRCDYFTKRDPSHREAGRGRRSRDGDHEISTSHSISTRIRVLPSHRRNQHYGSAASSFGHHGHHGTGQDMGMQSAGSSMQYHHEGAMISNNNPLLYLNPITCSLFLLILSVFLGLYVSFVRSLGRTVQHIKTEIDSQRTRDKFLVSPHRV